jgi:intraflagellar transport protein 46
LSSYALPALILQDTKLLPFIPDYIPCIGDIDAFLKPPRPDLKPDTLGLSIVDEPSLGTDPRVLDLQLRSLSKSSTTPHNIHSTRDNASLTDWLAKIDQLKKPQHTVAYSRPYPDIEDLMQEWPKATENALEFTSLPPADVDLSLEEYTRAICALLDIPVHDQTKDTDLIESLHVIFTLYSVFKESVHFNNEEYPLAAVANAAE